MYINAKRYTVEDWVNRYHSRTDIGAYLTHLTRRTSNMGAVDVLIKILIERNLLGSGNKGFIPGNEKAVCFQDTPLYGIAQNILHEEKIREELGGKLRYDAVGLMLPKPYLFRNGCRPVIYETKEIANELFSNVKWRIVTMDFPSTENIIDWSHEREWRIKGDFNFDISKAYVVLSNSDDYKEFIEKVDEIDKNILSEIKGIIVLDPILK